MRLLMAFTCLLRLKDALLVKESSKDLPEPVEKSFGINMKKNHKTFQKHNTSPKYAINQKEMQAAIHIAKSIENDGFHSFFFKLQIKCRIISKS